MPRIHPEIELIKDRNECPSCGVMFETSDAFDAHRLGKFATASKPSTRRCLTAAEMHEAGFRANQHGFMLSEVEHKYDPKLLLVHAQSQSTSGTE